jgi:branched-chain amino acid transport system substrate-binding protein
LNAGVLAGLSISLTGKYSRQGRQAFEGIQLWRSHCNGAGGIAAGGSARRRVRLIWYDDSSRAAEARRNALRLLEDDRIDVMFGPYASHLTAAVAQIAEEHKKVLWNHGGASGELFLRGYRYLVSIPSPAGDYFRMLPDWLLGISPPLRRICVARSTAGTFAAEVAGGLAEAAQAAGFPAVPFIPLGGAEQAIRELRAIRPEVVVLAGDFDDELRLVRQRHLWPASIRAAAAVAAGIQDFYRELGAAAEGIIGPSQWEPDAASNWFVQEFAQRYNAVPEYNAAAAFAAGLVLEQCAARAGGLDDLRLREAAAELDCETFFGRFRIDSTGRQIGHRMRLVRWLQGRKVVLV